MRRAAAPLPLLLALALALAVTACGGGLDTGPLEAAIAERIETDLPGTTIERVECPQGVQPRAGDVFVCRAHAVDGSVGTVEVTQVDEAGSVEFELTDVSEPGTAS